MSEVDIMLFYRLPLKSLFVLILPGTVHASPGLRREPGPQPWPVAPTGQKNIFLGQRAKSQGHCVTQFKEKVSIHSSFIKYLLNSSDRVLGEQDRY